MGALLYADVGKKTREQVPRETARKCSSLQQAVQSRRLAGGDDHKKMAHPMFFVRERTDNIKKRDNAASLREMAEIISQLSLYRQVIRIGARIPCRMEM